VVFLIISFCSSFKLSRVIAETLFDVDSVFDLDFTLTLDLTSVLASLSRSQQNLHFLAES